MTTGAKGIMDRLRHETAELHRQAESRPLQKHLGAGTLARETYAAWMSQLLLVHDTLERLLDEQVRRASHPGFAQAWQSLVRHSGNLRSDLTHFGLDPHSVEALDATAALLDDLRHWGERGDVALLGALYVLEGSMNGNRFIRKALERAYAAPDGAGLSYLDPYGDNQRATWQAFRERMDVVGFDENECEAILAGANRMFRGIGEISDEQFEAMPV